MISNHLSLVEALRPASDELAAQVAEFVAAGGEIEKAPPYNYKPKPITYSNQMPPPPKPFVRRRVEAPPCPSTRMTSAPRPASSWLSRYASSASRTHRPKWPQPWALVGG